MQNLQPKLTSTRNIKLPNPKTSAKLLEWKTCIAIFLVRRGEQLLTWKLEKDQLSIWELKISTCSTVEVQSTQFAERICTTKQIKRILDAKFVRKWIMLFISCNYSILRNNYTTFSRSIGWNQTWKHFVMNIKSCFFPKSTSPNRKRGYITLPRPSVSEILDHHRSYIVSHQPARYHFTQLKQKMLHVLHTKIVSSLVTQTPRYANGEWGPDCRYDVYGVILWRLDISQT